MRVGFMTIVLLRRWRRLPVHETDGFSLQDVDDVVLRDCGVTWGEHMTTRGEDVGQVRTTNVKVERVR